WKLAACASASAALYALVFTHTYPLLAHYAMPLLDLGKLSDYRPEGALLFFWPFSLLFVLYVAAYRLAASMAVSPPWVRWLVVAAPLCFVAALVLSYPIGAIDMYD